MGDADNTQNILSVDDVEALMENAWTDLDDGLDGLFSFVNLLNEHNAYVMSEIKSWQRLRRCFVALNVFVIPIMLSIWIAFGSTDLVPPDSGTEAVLQTIVIVLMLLSGGVGFPLYILSLMRAIFEGGKPEDEVPCLRSGSELTDNRVSRAPSALEGSDRSLPFGGDSLERISEVARQANRMFLDNFRQDLERRVNQAQEADQSENSGRFEPFKRDVDNSIPVAGRQLVDLDSGELPVHKEETDFCGFKVIILNKTQDLSVEIEKQEEAPTFSDDESRLLELSDEYRQSNVRSIAVENVGEGDSNKVWPKDLMGKDCWQDQVFGL